MSDSVFVSSLFLLSSTKNNPVFGAEVIPNHGKENGSNDVPDTRCSIEEGSTRDSLRVDAVGEPEYAEVTPNIPMEVNPGHGSSGTPHIPMEDNPAYGTISTPHIPMADNPAYGSTSTPHIPMDDNPAHGSTSIPHIPMEDNPAYGSI